MSSVTIESRFLVEKLRGLAFQVGAFIGGNSEYHKAKQAKYFQDILALSGQEKWHAIITQSILNMDNELLNIDSADYYSILQEARTYFQNMVLKAVEVENRYPRASYMAFLRKILAIDVERKIHENYTQYQVEIVIQKEKYPIRLMYFQNDRGGTFDIFQDWLTLCGVEIDAAFKVNGDLTDVAKAEICGKSLCFLKYFHSYYNDDPKRPSFWTYNRLSFDRDHLIDQFLEDADKGLLKHYQPQGWNRLIFPKVQAFLRSENRPSKLYFQQPKHQIILNANLSEQEIYISLVIGKAERIQGVLNSNGLSLLSTQYFVEIYNLLQDLENDCEGTIRKAGQESGNCAICGRHLESHGSIIQGVGPICAQKIQGMIQQSLFN